VLKGSWVFITGKEFSMMTSEQKQIHERAIEVSKTFRTSETQLIDLVQKVEEKRVFVVLGYSSLFEYCTKALLLSESNAQMLISISRKSRMVPELKTEIQKGTVSISKAQRIVSVITRENKSEWIQKASQLSKRELEKEVAKIHPEVVRETIRPISEDRMKLQLGISEATMKKLKRAQAVLSSKKRKPVSLEEVLESALDRFLEKEDPVEKAEREKNKSHCPGRTTQSKKPKTETSNTSGSGFFRTPIPAPTRHEIFRRDRGQCQFINPDGTLCHNPFFIELHHKKPMSRGGQNVVENLITLCAAHHSHQHSYAKNRTRIGQSSPNHPASKTEI
jgi:5-methylcytosine-specific restriction endonuclease McrA